MTLHQAAEDFLLEQRVRGNTEKTLAYYTGLLHKFESFFGANEELTSVTHAALRKYTVSLQESGIASTSTQTYIRGLRAFLTFCYTEEYLPENLSERFRLPKAKRPEIDILTDEECNRLMGSFNPKYYLQLRDYCMCALMLDCGLRMNEVVSLRMDYLHLQDGHLIVDGKGNKQRSVPIGYTMRRLLARYLRRRPVLSDLAYVFVTSSGQPIQESTLKQLFRKLKNRCGIPRLHAHLLRHTFATRFLENGADIFTLQQILGHTSLDMVKKYIHLTTRKTVKNFPNYSPLDKMH